MFDYLRNLTKSAGEKRQEALNAYLDTALSPKERQQFEQLLAQDSGLRLELEQRRLLKEQLRQLPRRRVPRHFTLDPAVYGRPQRQPIFQLYPAMRVAAVLTAFFFILAVAADLFLGQGAPAFGSASSQDVAMVAEEAVEAPAEAPTGLSVEVTRVVGEVEVAGEGLVEEMIVEEEPVEEPAMEEAAEEIMMAEAPEEEAAAAEEEAAANEAAAVAEASAPETADAATGTATDDNDAGAAAQEPASVATAAPTPLPAPALTEPAAVAATKSTAPRPSAETVAGERAVTGVSTIQPQIANETDDTAATAVPTTAPPPDKPVNELRLLQIGLGVALIVLVTAVFYVRRQL